MNNFYNLKSHLKIYTVLNLVLVVVMFVGNANAQTPYQASSTSQVKVSIGSNSLVSNLESNLLNAEGNFVIENGKLEDVKSLKLSMPIGYSLPGSDVSYSNTGQINFNLTHVMVLPILKRVFVVGFLTLNNVSHRIDMEFNLTHNKDESITLSGVKSLKLSDYQKEDEKPTIRLASYSNNDDEEILLSMNFVFAKITNKLEEQAIQSAPIAAALIQPKTSNKFEQLGTR